MHIKSKTKINKNSLDGGGFFSKPFEMNRNDDEIPKNIRSLTMTENVTSIRASAFIECTSLTSVIIPNSVKSIGNNAFTLCTSLTSVEFESPSSVINIGNAAFVGCAKLTSVEIPDSVTNIGHFAFQRCTGLTSVNFESPSSVINIGNYAFEGCTGLTSVEIPSSVINIGNSAFEGCTGLTSVEIPNSVKNIGNYVFRNCASLTSIKIPDSVESMGLNDCETLVKILNKTSLTSDQFIKKEDSFYDMIDLKDINVVSFLDKAENKDEVILKIGTQFCLISKGNISKGELFYPCLSVGGMMREENICKNIVFFNLRNFTSVGGMIVYDENLFENDYKFFVAERINVHIKSLVSKSVLAGGSVVGALHCQEGQGVNYVYRLFPFDYKMCILKSESNGKKKKIFKSKNNKRIINSKIKKNSRKRSVKKKSSKKMKRKKLNKNKKMNKSKRKSKSIKKKSKDLYS